MTVTKCENGTEFVYDPERPEEFLIRFGGQEMVVNGQDLCEFVAGQIRQRAITALKMATWQEILFKRST